jgi:acetyl-CoA acyltransferase
MSKQIQDAYIVAATRLPVAKKNGMFRTCGRTTCWPT